MDATPYKSDFVHVNGIKLHYLDWGGEGATLCLLPALGNTAYIFDRIAWHFAYWFHVLAVIRRGHGDSDYPETGYDLEALTEDIRQFRMSSKSTSPFLQAVPLPIWRFVTLQRYIPKGF